MSTEKLKSLIGTKFLFDGNLISYENLVKLLQTSGLYTDFIQKPLKDNLEVHSLYIKPDFEVAFLAKSKGADEYYRDAGYSCINYKEIDLYDVLKLLGYLDVKSLKDTQKEKKPKKSKFITFNYAGIIISYRKKIIKSVKYVKENEELYINTTLDRDVDINLPNVDSHLYNNIMSQL